jgi:thioredoxin-like negative regulator of GroEL
MITVTKFYADWCNPCKRMTVVLEENVKPFYLKDEVSFVDIDIDANPNLRTEYGINSIPAFVLIKNKEVVSTKIGSCSASDMRAWIDEFRAIQPEVLSEPS